MIGVDYPKITVGPHADLTVRMSLAAQALMERRGLNPLTLGLDLAPVIFRDGKPTTERNPKAVTNYVTVFSCMVAENFIDKSKPHIVNLDTAPSADYWRLLIDDFAAVEAAVNEAIKKAGEERKQRLQAAAPPENSLAS